MPRWALAKSESICWIKGNVDRRRETPEVVVSRIIPLEQGPAELTRGVIVRLEKGIQSIEQLERLLRTVRIHPGNLDLYFEIVGFEQVRRAIYKSGASMKIRYDDQLVGDLEIAVGPGRIRLLGQRGATARLDAPLLTSSRSPNEEPDPSRPATATESELDDGMLDDPDSL